MKSKKTLTGACQVDSKPATNRPAMRVAPGAHEQTMGQSQSDEHARGRGCPARSGPAARFADRPFWSRQAAEARCRRRAVPISDCLQDLRHRSMPRVHNAVLICHALTGRPACGKRASCYQESRAGGRLWSAPANRSTRNAISSSARTWWAPAWARLAHRQRIRKPASHGGSTFRSLPSATWCERRPCCSIISASTLCLRSPAAQWAACRCCNGRRAIPQRVFSRAADRVCHAPFGAEHRVP